MLITSLRGLLLAVEVIRTAGACGANSAEFCSYDVTVMIVAWIDLVKTWRGADYLQ